MRAQEEAVKMEEARFKGLPAWKVKLMKKKETDRMAREEEDRVRNAAKQEKMDKIASMPEWKRKLYLAKNPDAL